MKGYLAIDTGGTWIKHGLVSEKGILISKGKDLTPQTHFEDWQALIHRLVEAYQKRYALLGIALSCPGAVCETDDCIYGASALPYLHGPNLLKPLQERYRLPVAMANDANCAALAESWQGAGQGLKEVAYVVIGTGIGGAFIKEGKLHLGAHLHGGEFGYMLFSDDIWSKKASTSALIRSVNLALGESIETGEDVFSKAHLPKVANCLDKWFNELARGIYSLQYALDPECFILAGAISEREDVILGIQKACDALMDSLPIAKIKPIVKAAALKNDANLVGAVWHLLQKQ